MSATPILAQPEDPPGDDGNNDDGDAGGGADVDSGFDDTHFERDFSDRFDRHSDFLDNRGFERAMGEQDSSAERVDETAPHVASEQAFADDTELLEASPITMCEGVPSVSEPLQSIFGVLSALENDKLYGNPMLRDLILKASSA